MRAVSGHCFFIFSGLPFSRVIHAAGDSTSGDHAIERDAFA
jgi:hypothetical protein